MRCPCGLVGLLVEGFKEEQADLIGNGLFRGK